MVNDERRMRDWPVFARRAPDAEWYKPINDELRKIKRAAPRLWSFIMQGGLIARAPKGTHVWPLEGPKSTEQPLVLPTPPAGTPVCPDCGNLLEHGRCNIHGDPNDDSQNDPANILIQ
jgi:hypothetical protein